MRRAVPLIFTAAALAVAPRVEAQPGSVAAVRPVEAWVDGLLHWTTRGIEIAGIAVIVAGSVAATVAFLMTVAREGLTNARYERFRGNLGRSILLGLEFLVAADIIATVAVDPTLESVAVLAGIVAIRTFLSFALEVEVTGRWPWQNRGR